MRRITVIILLAALVVVAAILIWPRPVNSSISATFARYDTFSGWTNELFGFFVISNSGNHQVFCRGIADSWSRQLTQVALGGVWTDADPRPSVPYAFYLSPGESCEVAVLTDTNLPWRVGFRFRDSGFADYCPYFVWRMLPDGMRHVPTFQVVWTDPVEAYVKR